MVDLDGAISAGRSARTRGVSLREQVAEQIKQLIIRNRMRPGDLLPTEGELCEELGASRSSVREAVKVLAALDIVEVRHGHGTYVGKMSMAALVESLAFRGFLSRDNDYRLIADLVDVRATLEQGFAETLVASSTPEQRDRLHALATGMRTRAERGEDIIDLDRDFHLALMAPLDNDLVLQLTGAFWDVHAIVAPGLGSSSEQLVQTADAHLRIAERVAAEDAVGLREAIAAHYQPIRTNIAAHIARARED
ncbi:FadR/GntR family transcriptional regulator [Nocardioides deserti]|uniref:FadR/GntR family transcriptional regulator n=1 Tax=Nocardioides deserti TaxID=1588644 RepID=UPI001998C754|nr:FadR/GntR family transcriptional regulator [Nocardioides deserti]GGO68084.1 transcriptional regulator [Nocardioides deserti]